MDDFDRLVAGYLDDQLSTTDIAVLERVLQKHPDQARRFAAALRLHGQLHAQLGQSMPGVDVGTISDRLRAVQKPAAGPQTHTRPGMPRGRTSRPRRRAVAQKSNKTSAISFAILGVILAVAVIGWLSRTPNNPMRLTAANGAVHGHEPLVVGAEIADDQLLTIAAAATFVCPDGSRVRVRGPAQMQFLERAPGAVHIALHYGKALYDVAPQSSGGFYVSTPDLKVAVIGTAFSTDYQQQFGTVVNVSEGVVQVQRHADRKQRTVLAGQQIASNDDSFAVVDNEQQSTPEAKTPVIRGGISLNAAALPPEVRIETGQIVPSMAADGGPALMGALGTTPQGHQRMGISLQSSTPLFQFSEGINVRVLAKTNAMNHLQVIIPFSEPGTEHWRGNLIAKVPAAPQQWQDVAIPWSAFRLSNDKEIDLKDLQNTVSYGIVVEVIGDAGPLFVSDITVSSPSMP